MSKKSKKRSQRRHDASIGLLSAFEERLYALRRQRGVLRLYEGDPGQFSPRVLAWAGMLHALAVAAFFELKDLFYGPDLPDVPVDTAAIASGDSGCAALGMYYRGENRIGVNPYACLEHEQAADEMVETVAHELVHYWCAHNGIDDTTWGRDGRGKMKCIHNGRFRRAAMEHGLRCGIGPDGFNETSLTDESWELIRRECPTTAKILDVCHGAWL